MSDSANGNVALPNETYEHLKVQVYENIGALIDQCLIGHGDKQMLWSLRKSRYELLKLLASCAGAEGPSIQDWLTDFDRAIAPETVRYQPLIGE